MNSNEDVYLSFACYMKICGQNFILKQDNVALFEERRRKRLISTLDLMARMAYLKVLGADVKSFTQEEIRDINKIQSDALINRDWPLYASLLANKKIIGIEDKDADKILKQAISQQYADNSNLVTETDLKILGYDVKLSENNKEHIKALFENYMGNEYWPGVLRTLYLAKIVSAEKAEVTDKGLELTMLKKKEKLVVKIPPMPETRQF